MKQRLTILFLLTLLNCTSDSLPISTDLNGKWVDIKTKTDTLTFQIVGDKELMILARGTETKDGFTLPKYGSGPYEYKLLTGDKISLRWTLSSNSSFNDYHFKQSGDKLTIGNFFDPSSAGMLLTFEKLNSH